MVLNDSYSLSAQPVVFIKILVFMIVDIMCAIIKSTEEGKKKQTSVMFVGYFISSWIKFSGEPEV